MVYYTSATTYSSKTVHEHFNIAGANSNSQSKHHLQYFLILHSTVTTYSLNIYIPLQYTPPCVHSQFPQVFIVWFFSASSFFFSLYGVLLYTLSWKCNKSFFDAVSISLLRCETLTRLFAHTRSYLCLQASSRKVQYKNDGRGKN